MSEGGPVKSSTPRDARSVVRTARLSLSPWRERHRDAFVTLHGDAEVMSDLGGPFDRAAADAKFDRYVAAAALHGVSRWAVEDRSGILIGYAGILFRTDAAHPLGSHHEIGWRFARLAWGQGYATESATSALASAAALGISRVLAYTAADNRRSQAVMARLGLRRDPALDFTAEYVRGPWAGLVWVADTGVVHAG